MPLAGAAARLRRIAGLLDVGQWRTIGVMGAIVLALHLIGFGLLLFVVAPHHGAGAASGTLAVGTGLTAYTLGLRHAFDADHIAAIDNTTRKLMAEDKRPVSVGFFFSLGHSTVVFALAFVFAIGVRALSGQVTDDGSTLRSVTAWVGTGVSGTFLYLIAAVNLAILWGIVGVFMRMRSGVYDERELEAQLSSRGLMNRYLGALTARIGKPWHMYPIGILFGIGFDTATEVALLFLAAGAAGAGLPFYAILCLPMLFAAGMSLLDTLDGSFMNFAYGWAFSQPVRKVFYNLTITGLSVAVSLAIGTIELVGLLAEKLGAQGSFWAWWENVDVNTLGFVIVGVFVLTWTVALAVWHFGKIEQRWTGRRSRSRRMPSGFGSTISSRL